ncbi:MAG: Wzy polymerase domain-containing protein [Rhodoferax sp.]|uniref:Wzy polymerase domain-containing protein n=1 Tax=Rhodoferax sp. TaxID=50421 RepID=UPI002628ADA0|nr:Wzy polymerase domain-containing protein [Rhodoferax sp.]MDD5332978.1 Wzy polymerase domain-containing protein [Rhodoferax sp.]
MQSLAVFFFIALPWLNPFSFGPSPAVVPWLVTLASLAFALPWLARVRLADVAPGAWLVAALLSSMLGLLQYFGATAWLGPWVNHTDVGEAFANLRQRNQFATLTNIGVAALLWWFPSSQLRPVFAANGAWFASTRWRTRAALAAAVLLALGNAASSSRTGMVQLLLLLALAWIWRPRGRPQQWFELRRVLLVTLLAYAIAAFALPVWVGLDPHANGILARLHDAGPQCTGRMTLWSNVWHLIVQRPWLGWGWGELDYAHFITLYPGERFCDILDNAHNLPLHLAVELGLPLALAVCAAFVWLVGRAKPWLETDRTRQLAWAVLAVILLHSLLEYPLWYGPFQMAFGLSIWLLGRAPDRFLKESEGLGPVVAWPAALVSISLLALVAYAGWDYQRVSQIYRVPAMRSEAYRDNTLEKVGDSWLFQNQVHFAELTTAPLTLDNASHVHALATDLLHFSPEARVIEKLVESATLLGLKDEARFYRVRYQAAFPDSYALWATTHGPLEAD